MRELIKQIISKLFCSHKWIKMDSVESYQYPDSKRPFKIVYIYTCENCGKIHKEKIL